MVESAKEKSETPKLTTKRLTNMAFAFKQTGTLLAAIELDLFSTVSQGATTIPEVAKSLGLPLEAVDKLVTACTALGLLEKRDDCYSNSPDVDRYLVRGRPTYYGDYLLYQARSEYDVWKELGAAFQRPPSPTGVYQTLAQDANMARGLTVAGYNSSISAGHRLARDFDFSPYSLFLDLGGGSGCYSIAAAQRYPNLRAIVFDFSTVCAVAEEFIAQAGLSDRITTCAGDFMVDEFPQGADLVGLIGCIHAYTPEEKEFVIKKAFQAVAPGGSFIFVDYMLDNDRTGPLEAAFRHLDSVALSSKGWISTAAEISEYMRRAGAVDIVASDFIPGSMSRVIGRKPK